MFQMKMQKKGLSDSNSSYAKSLTSIILMATLSLTALSSCSQKSKGVRSQVKSTNTNLNPAVSSQADQQAAAQNANYKIYSVSLPNQTGTGYSVDVQLTDPSNQYLPLTTNHDGGNLDSQGIYTDSARGVQVYVQARCSSDECYKYTLLVTVVRNNQSLFQSAAISFKNDCQFNAISVGANSGQMFRSLDELESRYSNLQPRNDADSCSM